MNESIKVNQPTLIKNLQVELDPFFQFLDIGILIVNIDLSVLYCNQWIKSRCPENTFFFQHLNELFPSSKSGYHEKLITSVIKAKAPRLLSSVLHTWLIPLPDPRFEDGIMRQGCSISPFQFRELEKDLAIIQVRDDSDKILQVKKLQKEIQEKNDAIAELKILKGMIPICASCKSIRDDEGYWNRLEAYIEKHSEASFSHGICPDCEVKLYGNEEWYLELKEERKKNQ